MKKTLFILLLSTIISCNTSNGIEGNIYIKLIDIHNIYGMPQEKIKEFKTRINNPNQTEYSKSEQKLIKHYKILIKNDLFNKPSFKLKLHSGEIINIYTSESEYGKLKNELKNLKREKEKISVKFIGEKISNGIFDEAIYKASRISSVIKTAGKTDWEK